MRTSNRHRSIPPCRPSKFRALDQLSTVTSISNDSKSSVIRREILLGRISSSPRKERKTSVSMWKRTFSHVVWGVRVSFPGAGRGAVGFPEAERRFCLSTACSTTRQTVLGAKGRRWGGRYGVWWLISVCSGMEGSMQMRLDVGIGVR